MDSILIYQKESNLLKPISRHTRHLPLKLYAAKPFFDANKLAKCIDLNEILLKSNGQIFIPW